MEETETPEDTPESEGGEGEEKDESSTDDSSKPKVDTMALIDNAREQADRLEGANKKAEELLGKEAEMMAKRALGGQTELGKEEKKEQTPEEYANSQLAGE